MRKAACLAFALSVSGVLGHTIAGDRPRLQRVSCCATYKAHEIGGVLLAGQPTREGLTDVGRRGIRTVINLRPADELNWDEAALVKDLGMQYFNVPFRSANDLTDQVFDRVRVLLGDKQHHPVMLHCASANRVGAVWLAHRVLNDGLSYSDALAEARAVGLRSLAYKEITADYIQRAGG
jgi:uncharacterized protein (TIGR01244 family)